MTFGERLAFLRKTYKRTQEQLAQVLGIAKSTYCGYEISNREPSLEKITKLATFFEVPADFLLGTGVFNNWDEIQNHKETIIEMLNNYFKNSLPLVSDDISFINFLEILIEKIDFAGDSVTIFPRISPQDFHLTKECFVAENIEVDAGKQKLISNYDRMNETGQHCLVEYSDYLTSKPENLKISADSHKMMA